MLRNIRAYYSGRVWDIKTPGRHLDSCANAGILHQDLGEVQAKRIPRAVRSCARRLPGATAATVAFAARILRIELRNASFKVNRQQA